MTPIWARFFVGLPEVNTKHAEIQRRKNYL